MPGSTLVTAPEITIDGAEIPAAHYDAIIDLLVEQAVSVPSQLSLRLSDPNFELLDGTEYRIGGAVKVMFPDGLGAATTVFDGEIVSVGVDQNATRPDTAELTVTALDRSHRLGHRTRVRTFQRQSYADVVRAIAQEEGLRSDVSGADLRFDYLIQTTTNYAFLEDMAFRSGNEWCVEGQTLHFRPRQPGAAVAVAYGTDIQRFRARYTAMNEASGVTVRSWDPRSKQVVVGTSTVQAVRGTEANAGTAALGVDGRRDAAPWNGPLVTSGLVAGSSDEATQLATSLSTRIGTSDLSAKCECVGRPDIAAGSLVEITGVGSRLGGTYYVSRVEHRFGRHGDMTTTFTTGSTAPSGLVDLLGGPRGDDVTAFGRSGLTIGIVTNNKDPDNIGRVRVKFPALSDDEESWWARVVTPGGGSNAGLMMMPQINDEVLVGFEHGDPRRPFVLGGLWGPRAKPPTASDRFLANNKVVEWGLRTEAGATLAFRGGQQPSEKHFKVALPDGTTHYLGSDKIELIAQSKSIELKSGQASVLITDQGDVKLKGANVTIDATSGVKVNGVNIELSARAGMKAKAGATFEAGGSATTTISSSGITEVKGSLVKIQ